MASITRSHPTKHTFFATIAVPVSSPPPWPGVLCERHGGPRNPQRPHRSFEFRDASCSCYHCCRCCWRRSWGTRTMLLLLLLLLLLLVARSRAPTRPESTRGAAGPRRVDCCCCGQCCFVEASIMGRHKIRCSTWRLPFLVCRVHHRSVDRKCCGLLIRRCPSELYTKR
jgi:hypothetical protein